MLLKIDRVIVKSLLGLLLLLSIIGSIQVLLIDISDSKKIIPLILITLLGLVGWHLLALRINQKCSKMLLFLVGCLLLIYQLVMVYSLSGGARWDVGTVISQAMANPIYPTDYFSVYPNNLALVAIESILYHLSIKPSLATFTLILGFVNIFLVDAGVAIIYQIAKKIGGSLVSKIVLVLSLFLILITPYVALFYTDLVGFFLSSLILYVVLLPSNWKNDLVIGILGAFAYFIKPSLFITIISLGLIKIINMLTNKMIKKEGKDLLLILLILGTLITCGTKVINSKIDTSRSFDAWHFIAMGMNPNGGYLASDVEKNWNINSPQARKKYNQELIKQRLKNYGAGGYSQFLIKKQINNTADATFGWKKEGGDAFLIPLQKPNIVNEKVRAIFLSSASKRNWLGFVGPTQFTWTIALIGVLASLFIKNRELDLVHLTILAFMIYLLLFEGGRSRYVIQFLPFILVAGASGLAFLVTTMKLKLSSLKK